MILNNDSLRSNVDSFPDGPCLCAPCSHVMASAGAATFSGYDTSAVESLLRKLGSVGELEQDLTTNHELSINQLLSVVMNNYGLIDNCKFCNNWFNLSFVIVV